MKKNNSNREEFEKFIPNEDIIFHMYFNTKEFLKDPGEGLYWEICDKDGKCLNDHEYMDDLTDASDEYLMTLANELMVLLEVIIEPEIAKRKIKWEDNKIKKDISNLLKSCNLKEEKE